jgi:hypothetical protein
MKTSMLRRPVALLASAGVTTAIALLPSASAHAISEPTLEAAGNANAQYVGPTSGGSCDETSGDDDVTSPGVSFHHGTKHQSVNLGATFTSSDNSADQVKVKGHVTTALTIKRKGGGLSSLDFTAQAAVTISHTESGSACRGSGDMFGAIPLMNFSESKKGHLNIAYASSKPSALIEFLVFSYKTDEPVTEIVNVGDHTHGTAQVLLKPGKYAVAESEIGAFGGQLLGKSASLRHKTAKTVEVKATFTPQKH